MPLGPGKYGARAAALLADDDAAALIIISIGGPAGPAFDVATRTRDDRLLAHLPKILRNVADALDDELRSPPRRGRH